MTTECRYDPACGGHSGRAKREPESITPCADDLKAAGYGFRARAFRAPRNDVEPLGRSAMNMGFWGAVIAAGLLVSGVAAQAATYEVTTRNDIEFAEHDGTKLLGDLYLPKGLDKAPVLVAVHGGG